jgi:hypothetical protein
LAVFVNSETQDACRFFLVHCGNLSHRFLMNVLVLAFWLLSALPEAPLVDIVLRQADRTPEMQMEDAYKWLFQATRGGEHAEPDSAAARLRLEREWAGLNETPLVGEALWTPLTPDGSIVRLNLRPYCHAGGSPDALLQAFLDGADSFSASNRAFQRAWRHLGRNLQEESAGALSHTEWKRMDRQMRRQGYPAVHHSQAYRQTYFPAYRILPRKQLNQLLNTLPREDED